MQKYLLAAVAAAAIATPAMARDGSGYVGIEGGALFPKNQHVDATVNFTDPLVTDIATTRAATIRHKTGYDVDLIGGYDFGMFRLEGELGYKRSALKSARFNNAFITAFNTGAGTSFTGDEFDLNGHTSVLSGMINGLVDFGGNGGVGAYAGGGFGRARVKELGDSDSAWAWQLLAGVYMPVSDNIDVGLKYRYFRTGNLNFDDSVTFTGVGAGSGGVAAFDASNHYSSHSLLASLVFNFGAPAAAPAPVIAPPPPPPAAPATQTCPDGSVILATSSCPVPPPPPPPPPVERGERGR
jgi:opacity protein-like surface antigen